MDFNQLFNNFKRFFKIPVALKITEILAYIAGTLIILATVSSLISGQWGVASKLLKLSLAAITKIIGFGLPYFVKLLLASWKHLWLPILLYTVISLFTASRWGRFYLCLATLCGFILTFKTVVLNDISFSSLPDLLIYCMEVYLLLLWTFPREVWNFIGGAFCLLQGAIVLVIPDIPGYFDDFGLIAAIFAFLFLYLHTTASLVQRFVDTFVAIIRNYVTQLSEHNFSQD